MTIDELLEHYRYKLSLPNLTQRSRTTAEATYGYLEKLKPMRINAEYEYDGSLELSCGICGCEIYEKMNFCPNCGQAIDWED